MCLDEIGYLVVALMWHRLENYGLHSGNISKLHLGYVKGTDNMGPACRDTKNNQPLLRHYNHKHCLFHRTSKRHRKIKTHPHLICHLQVVAASYSKTEGHLVDSLQNYQLEKILHFSAHSAEL